MSQRTLKYDIIRCISMCLVLGIHTLNKTQGFAEPYNASWYFFGIGTSICMICNPLFFMLSGKFNLSSNLGTADDYRRYYIKRFASTIVPFVIMSLVCYFVILEIMSKIYLEGAVGAFINGSKRTNRQTPQKPYNQKFKKLRVLNT